MSAYKVREFENIIEFGRRMYWRGVGHAVWIIAGLDMVAFIIYKAVS